MLQPRHDIRNSATSSRNSATSELPTPRASAELSIPRASVQLPTPRSSVQTCSVGSMPTNSGFRRILEPRSANTHWHGASADRPSTRPPNSIGVVSTVVIARPVPIIQFSEVPEPIQMKSHTKAVISVSDPRMQHFLRPASAPPGKESIAVVRMQMWSFLIGIFVILLGFVGFFFSDNLVSWILVFLVLLDGSLIVTPMSMWLFMCCGPMGRMHRWVTSLLVVASLFTLTTAVVALATVSPAPCQNARCSTLRAAYTVVAGVLVWVAGHVGITAYLTHRAVRRREVDPARWSGSDDVGSAICLRARCAMSGTGVACDCTSLPTAMPCPVLTWRMVPWAYMRGAMSGTERMALCDVQYYRRV